MQTNKEFGLLRDIAKANKHVELLYGKPQVQAASQVKAESLGWDQAGWDEGRWDSPPQVTASTNSGDKRVVDAIVKNAIAFLDTKMKTLGL